MRHKFQKAPLLVATLLLLAGAGAVLAGCASAEKKATRRMEELNRAALADIRKGKPQDARRQLMEAVEVGSEAGLDHDALMARTHLALGAVYAGPLKDRTRAVTHMGRALAINPQVKLGGSLATGPARRALAAARAERNQPLSRSARREAEAAPEPARPPPARAARPEPPPPPEPAPVAEPPRRSRRARPEPRPEPVVVAPEPPPPPEPVSAGEGAEPLNCPTPEQAPPDTDLTLRCNVQPGVKPGRLSLFYRPSGSETFTEVPMRSSKKGTYYRGVVPAEATNGKSLQYYVVGRGTPRLASGNAESPNLILVREGAPPIGATGLVEKSEDEDEEEEGEEAPGLSSADENPLAEVEREREREGYHARAPRRWWAGFALGSGFGWQPGGPLEFRKDQQVAAGPLGPGLMHIQPEAGYQLTEQFAVSLQLRAQFVPTQGAGDPTPGKPANKAIALLARAVYSLGEGNTRPFLSACLGGGDGFRLRVPPQRMAGLVRSDTVKGGPLLGGGGVGVIHHFNPRLAWSSEFRTLVGFPTTAYMFELASGMELAF